MLGWRNDSRKRASFCQSASVSCLGLKLEMRPAHTPHRDARKLNLAGDGYAILPSLRLEDLHNKVLPKEVPAFEHVGKAPLSEHAGDGILHLGRRAVHHYTTLREQQTNTKSAPSILAQSLEGEDGEGGRTRSDLRPRDGVGGDAGRAFRQVRAERQRQRGRASLGWGLTPHNPCGAGQRGVCV